MRFEKLGELRGRYCTHAGVIVNGRLSGVSGKLLRRDRHLTRARSGAGDADSCVGELRERLGKTRIQ